MAIGVVVLPVIPIMMRFPKLSSLFIPVIPGGGKGDQKELLNRPRAATPCGKQRNHIKIRGGAK